MVSLKRIQTILWKSKGWKASLYRISDPHFIPTSFMVVLYIYTAYANKSFRTGILGRFCL
jgi:hypothetical protein